MNPAFSLTTDSLDNPEIRAQFFKSSCDFMDDLITKLKKLSTDLDAYLQMTYNVTHAFSKFGYGFDPEEEVSPLGPFINALSCTGQMGVAVCGFFDNLKKEYDALLRRTTEMRARFATFQKTIKPHATLSPDAKMDIELLKMDFISEILDACNKLFASHYKMARDMEHMIKPVMDSKVPVWTERSCQIQQRCLQLRDDGAGVLADATPNRKGNYRVFGTKLELLRMVPGFDIPQILFDTSQALLSNPTALETEGIFRKSCSLPALRKIQDAYDDGLSVVLSKQDPILIAAVLKSWLRMLPEPLISVKLSVRFSSLTSKDPATLKSLVMSMPPLNRRCLHKLIEVARAVSVRSAKNLMNSKNLALVLGPNLSRRDDVDMANPVALNQLSSMNELVELFITNYNIIFGPFKA